MMKRFRKLKRELVPWLFLAIPLLLWIVFFARSFVDTVIMSFHDWRTGQDVGFAGLMNYARVFFDEDAGRKEDWILRSFLNTTIWSAVMLAGTNLFGLLFGYWLSCFTRQRVQKFFLGLLFCPSLFSAVIVSNVQVMLFEADSTGIVNSVLMNAGLISEPIMWFKDPDIALYSLMIFPFFLGFGGRMLFYYLGMTGVPKSYMEAARMDTDSGARIFFSITLPLIRPMIFLNVVMSLIEGFKVVTPMMLIIDQFGGPGYETNSVVFVIYDLIFSNSSYPDYGLSSATAVLLFLVIAAVTLLQRKIEGEKIAYE